MKINKITDPHLKNLLFVYWLLLGIGFNANSIAQTEPTLKIDKQNPSCSGNGRITALLQNADNAGNLVYNLFELPSETLLASKQDGLFEGLDEGQYKISANYTIDDSQQETSIEVTLNSDFFTLSFTEISNMM